MILLAYVDPGSGLLIWQMLVAILLGALFYLKQVQRWIVNLFSKITRREPKREVSLGAGPEARK